MFIRAKRISGKEYAYLVRSEWTPAGPRQKVAGYMGKLVRPAPSALERPPLPAGGFPALIRALARRELLAHGFAEQDGLLSSGDISVDLAAGSMRSGRGKCAIAMREGFLCGATLAQLLALVPEGHEERDMRRLVTALLEAGLHAEGDELATVYAAWRRGSI